MANNILNLPELMAHWGVTTYTQNRAGYVVINKDGVEHFFAWEPKWATTGHGYVEVSRTGEDLTSRFDVRSQRRAVKQALAAIDAKRDQLTYPDLQSLADAEMAKLLRQFPSGIVASSVLELPLWLAGHRLVKQGLVSLFGGSLFSATAHAKA